MPKKHVKQLKEAADTVRNFGNFSESKLIKRLGQVLKDPKFKSALDDFHDDPKSRKEASEDPKLFCKRKGLTIPKGLVFHLKDNNWRAGCCGTIKITLDHIVTTIEVGFHYDSDSGFGWGC